ncbi:MAG: hypothetical protein EBZ78_05115 [Verrucomicrobia bacterium]|nr:hypothetical protein [Verrucomicrobiota bacterium]
MTAAILCGGLGTRLKGVLDDRPKCLAPILGCTYLDFLTDYLHSQGINNFIFATGYRHDQVDAWLLSKKRPWIGQTSREETPLGTGGALRLASLKIKDETFFACNGDTFLTLDLRAMMNFHLKAGAPITIAAVKVSDTAEFGRLEVADGRVVGFKEKGISGPGLINGGCYVIQKSFLRAEPREVFSLEKDSFMRTGTKVAAYLTNSDFLDIGTPSRLASADAWLAKKLQNYVH